MSLVKASLFDELDFSINFKKWLHSKRADPYKTATSEYLAKLRQLFRENLKQRELAIAQSLRPGESATTSTGLVVIRLGEDIAVPSGDDNKPPPNKLSGIQIERSSFPAAQVNHRVSLIELKDNVDLLEEDITKKKVLGIVIAVDSSHIRIKFKEPLLLDTIEEAEQAETTEVVEKLDKLCEEQCHKDSDDEDKEKEQQENEKGEKEGSVDSDVEDAGQKPPELDLVSDKGSIKGEQDKEVAESPRIQVKPTKFGIRLEPADDETITRMINCFESALRKIEKQSCSMPLHKCLLGYYSNHSDSITPKSRVVTLNELPKPKYNQMIAIEQSIKRRISLVEGPAGSGKTLIGAHIACNVARVKDFKVLICSPLQSTVDKLTELIDRVSSVEVVKLSDTQRHKSSARIILQAANNRLGRTLKLKRRTNEDLSSDIEILSNYCNLDVLVDDEIYSEARNKFKSLYHNNGEHMHEQALKQVKLCSPWRRGKIEKRLLNRANIVCCTTSQAGSHLLEDLSFDMLILDDAQLISEVDCIIPLMTKGLKQVTLLSDMRRQIRLARINRHSTISIANSQVTNSPVANDSSVDAITNEQQNDIISATIGDQSKGENANGIASSSKNSIDSKSFAANAAERRKAARQKSIERRQKRLTDTTRLMESQSDMTSTTVSSSNISGPSNELGGLFERWLAIGLPAVDLRHQFRMHEALSSFTNYHFYLSRCKNDSVVNEKLTEEILHNLLPDDTGFDWLPKSRCLTAILKSESNSIDEELDNNIDRLLEHAYIQPAKIGVIFNLKRESYAYAWQSRSIRHGDSVKCGTIEDFIGQERDFIILVAGCAELGSARQSANLAPCSQIELNFMVDDTTLNLALTRARLGLFIITDYNDIEQSQQNGGPSTSKAETIPLSTDKEHYCSSWRKLVDYYRMNDLIS